MDVSIIIVNYNTASITLECIASIYKQSTGIKIEIIVIDNNSSDHSFEKIKSRYADVIIISNSENLGFGVANNMGITYANGKYVFLLNSDTILLNNAIKFFFEYMENNNTNGDIGAIGSVMYDRKIKLNFRNSYYNFPSCKNLYRDIYLNLLKVPKDFSKDFATLINEGRLSVDFIVGADLFIPKNVLDKIGYFDPIFFLYWEEVDLQYRMNLFNFKRYIIKGPEIIHLEGGSTQKTVKNWKRMMDTESLIKFTRKHKSKLSVLLVKLYYMILVLSSISKRVYKPKEQLIYIKKIFYS